jgi:hypothetical protein
MQVCGKNGLGISYSIRPAGKFSLSGQRTIFPRGTQGSHNSTCLHKDLHAGTYARLGGCAGGGRGPLASGTQGLLGKTGSGFPVP